MYVVERDGHSSFSDQNFGFTSFLPQPNLPIRIPVYGGPRRTALRVWLPSVPGTFLKSYVKTGALGSLRNEKLFDEVLASGVGGKDDDEQRTMMTKTETLLPSSAIHNQRFRPCEQQKGENILNTTTMMSNEDDCVPEEISLKCVDGIIVTGQKWQYQSNNNNNNNNVSSSTPPKPPPQPQLRILCIHGWLDNCRSYYRLAPSLVTQLQEKNQNATVVAIDLPGHGSSSHKSVDGPFAMLSEYVFYISEAIAQLGWDDDSNTMNSDGLNSSSSKLILIGHSLGCAISVLYAACYPDKVTKLVLLEGVGPRSMDGKDVSKHVTAHIDTRRRSVARPRPPSIYPTIEMAVEARCMTAKTFPGKQYISETAARELVRRATKDIIKDDGTPALQFLHDPRLYWPSLQYFTHQQTESLYTNLQCKVCLLIGDDGWPFHQDDRLTRAKELLNPSIFESLPGSHHFHMDPDTSNNVINAVLSFLST